MKTLLQNANNKIDIREINLNASTPAKFIENCELAYQSQIEDVARLAINSNKKVVLLAGPSSSGKTTTAHKIAEAIEKMGKVAKVASLDDFYLGMEFYPKLPDGSPDMECVEALDLDLINIKLAEVINKGKAYLPIFDFENSCRAKEENLVDIGKEGVLVIEGIHALNPLLTKTIDRKSVIKAYVSTRTVYLDGEKEILTPKNARLIRRMVRDHNFRNRSPIDTLQGWKDVLDGEEKYIYPFRDDVDYKIDSAFDYEGCVFHHYILPMIDELKDDKVYMGKVKEIVDALEQFNDIDYLYIPKKSLLREFIGAKNMKNN